MDHPWNIISIQVVPEENEVAKRTMEFRKGELGFALTKMDQHNEPIFVMISNDINAFMWHIVGYSMLVRTGHHTKDY